MVGSEFSYSYWVGSDLDLYGLGFSGFGLRAISYFAFGGIAIVNSFGGFVYICLAPT